jgi:hypothetical protein
MSFVVKKRDLTDPAQLQALIVEHADDLERGLTILDTRLFLGQATIDVIGLDADGSLVLIVLGLVADEEMFLKAVEAYSWCLEYPDAIRRLYPAAQFSSAQPPRVMFVVERMPDAFHRKIKQLGFPDVDCVEFRHLDVDGTAAVYFDRLAHLHRGAVPAAPTESTASPAVPMPNGRPTSVKLQKLLGADRPVPAREPAPVVRMLFRAPAKPEAKPTPVAPRIERPAPPTTSVEERVAPASPAVRLTEAPRVAPPIAAPSAPAPDAGPTSVAAETLAGMPEALAQSVETADVLVELFATVEPHTTNGHVEPAMTIPAPVAAVVRELEPAMIEAEPPVHATEPVTHQLEPTTPDTLLAIESVQPADAAAEEVGDIVAAEICAPPVEPVAAQALITDDIAAVPAPLELESPPTIAVERELESLSTVEPEPELKLELESHPTVEPEPALELESPPMVEPEPALKLELEAHPRVEPELQVALESRPMVETELKLELESPVIAEPEPSIAAPSTESPQPVAPEAASTSARSVFSRRPPEALAARNAKVSFAGVAKDLLPQSHRAPTPEPPAAAPRASVEEITRGALDELVGGTDRLPSADRSTTFAKPGGAFAKPSPETRRRTIAPPASEAQPVVGAARLGGAPKVVDAGGAAAPAPADGTTPQPAPGGFEGLQFPNDGVLTRQWMEFLNQMAAGK